MIVFKEWTHGIIEACLNVFKELGCGFTEPVYQDALEAELTFLKIPFEREKRLQVVYKGVLLKSDFYADFVCYDSIIVELKAVAKLMPAHKAQVLNYLNASGLEVGLLVNFGEPSLKFERISKFKKQPAITNPPPF